MFTYCFNKWTFEELTVSFLVYTRSKSSRHSFFGSSEINYGGKNNLQNHLIGYSTFNYIDPYCANAIYCEHVHSACAEHWK